MPSLRWPLIALLFVFGLGLSGSLPPLAWAQSSLGPGQGRPNPPPAASPNTLVLRLPLGSFAFQGQVEPYRQVERDIVDRENFFGPRFLAALEAEGRSCEANPRNPRFVLCQLRERLTEVNPTDAARISARVQNFRLEFLPGTAIFLGMRQGRATWMVPNGVRRNDEAPETYELSVGDGFVRIILDAERPGFAPLIVEPDGTLSALVGVEDQENPRIRRDYFVVLSLHHR